MEPVSAGQEGTPLAGAEEERAQLAVPGAGPSPSTAMP